MSPQFGVFYQVYDNKKAARFVLENFREHFPENPVVLISDGGEDFSDLAAKLSPIFVSTGKPAHNASLQVVCAPYGNVSRNKSANLCLAKCSSKAMGFANISLFGSTSLFLASCFKFLMVIKLFSNNQSTLPLTFFNIFIQQSKTLGVIL